MRRRSLPDSRLMGAAVGASILALPTSAAAGGDPPSIQAHVEARTIHFGRNVIVSGRATGQHGHTLGLEFARAGTSTWRQIATSRVKPSGSFRLSAPLLRSGTVKVIDTTPQTTSASAVPLTAAAAAAGPPASAPERVAVAADIHVGSRHLDLLGGGTAHVLGRLLPGTSGRPVVLQLRRGGHWSTVARARTGGRGGFDLHYRSGSPGRQLARVRFAGDRSNSATSTHAGAITVYTPSFASWYYDAGTTACGFHAYYGVANQSLPCGTKVAFVHGGRKVTATVDDRGPYVGGREWDLNQNTAGALGFAGVSEVWSSS